MLINKKKLNIFLFLLFTSGICQAQFLDSFDKKKIEEWFFFTGDGDATMDFVQKDGYSRIIVDATKDKYNVWWAIIKRDITAFLDVEKLPDPSYELRVEARVRVSEAPRRLNFMINTQRTIDFHKQLMEYDIPDTTDWHIISMTTRDFDAVPGDTVYVQLDVTDWGLGKYHVDLDYYRAEVVNVTLVGPDKGEPLPYHPPVPNINTFSHHLPVTHDAILNADFPNVNFNDWQVKDSRGYARILTVDENHWVILRWDLEKFRNTTIKGSGVLELTTYSVQKGGNYVETYGEDLGMEFGKIRVIEILGGDPEWDQKNVTYTNFIQGNKLADVFNSQMIFDLEPSEEPGSKNYITISRPVLQRLLEGKTKGLLIRPLGALDASFYASEDSSSNRGPKLHFNSKP